MKSKDFFEGALLLILGGALLFAMLWLAFNASNTGEIW